MSRRARLSGFISGHPWDSVCGCPSYTQLPVCFRGQPGDGQTTLPLGSHLTTDTFTYAAVLPRVSRALWLENFQVIQLFCVHENGNPCHHVWFAGFLRHSTNLTLSVHSAEEAAQNSNLRCGLSTGLPCPDVAVVLPCLRCGTLGSFL